MKKVLIIISAISLSSYLYLDVKLSKVGLSDLGVYSFMPYGVKLDYNEYDSDSYKYIFTDKYGFSLISQTNKYTINGKDIILDKVRRYFYNDSLVQVEVLDIKGEKYFITIVEEKNKLALKLNNYTINDISDSWIVLNKNKSYFFYLRNYLLFIFIFSVIALLMIFVKGSRTSK